MRDNSKEKTYGHIKYVTNGCCYCYYPQTRDKGYEDYRTEKKNHEKLRKARGGRYGAKVESLKGCGGRKEG